MQQKKKSILEKKVSFEGSRSFLNKHFCEFFFYNKFHSNKIDLDFFPTKGKTSPTPPLRSGQIFMKDTEFAETKEKS